MLVICNILAVLFSNFDLALYETNEESLEWKDQTLMVTKSHVMMHARPIFNSEGSEASDNNREKILSTPEQTCGQTAAAPGKAPSVAGTVLLPDLFVFWAKTPLKFNPNYERISREADIWFKE
jgi:hypothetical protein